MRTRIIFYLFFLALLALHSAGYSMQKKNRTIFDRLFSYAPVMVHAIGAVAHIANKNYVSAFAHSCVGTLEVSQYSLLSKKNINTYSEFNRIRFMSSLSFCGLAWGFRDYESNSVSPILISLACIFSYAMYHIESLLKKQTKVLDKRRTKTKKVNKKVNNLIKWYNSSLKVRDDVHTEMWDAINLSKNQIKALTNSTISDQSLAKQLNNQNNNINNLTIQINNLRLAPEIDKNNPISRLNKQNEVNQGFDNRIKELNNKIINLEQQHFQLKQQIQNTYYEQQNFKTQQDQINIMFNTNHTKIQVQLTTMENETQVLKEQVRNTTQTVKNITQN